MGEGGFEGSPLAPFRGRCGFALLVGSYYSVKRDCLHPNLSHPLKLQLSLLLISGIHSAGMLKACIMIAKLPRNPVLS